MILRIILFFLTIWVLTIFKISAQKIWSLNECITYTVENSTVLKNAEINQKQQVISLSQARLNQLPQIGMEISIDESFGRTVNPETNTYSNIDNLSNSYNVGGSMVLFSGFAQRNRIAFERFNLLAENNRFEQQKNIIIYSVINSYYSLLLNKGLHALLQENVKLMKEQYFSVKKFISVGLKAESDIYELEAKLATDSFLLIQQEGYLQKSILFLKSTMNFSFSESLEIDTLVFTFKEFDDTLNTLHITKAAKQNLPNLKITENQLIAAKKYVAQIRGSFSPGLQVYSGWNTQYYRSSEKSTLPYRTQIKDNMGEYIGISMNIPLFARFNKINSLRMANLEYKRAENMHHENIINFEKEINEAYIDWQTAKNEHSAAQKQLIKAEVAYLTAEKKFGTGKINVIEFYIQKNELLRAKTILLRTNLQLALKEKFVRFLLVGKWDFNS